VARLATGESGLTKAERILAALGGVANVVDIEPCITRLRVETTDPAKLDDEALRTSGALGVVRCGKVIHVVVGADADALAAEIDNLR
jgi:PTS system N-acetylglucosamine-specific IIB component